MIECEPSIFYPDVDFGSDTPVKKKTVRQPANPFASNAGSTSSNPFSSSAVRSAASNPFDSRVAGNNPFGAAGGRVPAKNPFGAGAAAAAGRAPVKHSFVASATASTRNANPFGAGSTPHPSQPIPLSTSIPSSSGVPSSNPFGRPAGASVNQVSRTGQLQQKQILQPQQHREMLKRQQLNKQTGGRLATARNASESVDNIFSVYPFALKIPKDYEKIIKIAFGGRTSAIAVKLPGKRGCVLYRWIRAQSGKDDIVKFKFSVIVDIFVDPSGHHILVSAESKVYYVHSSFAEGKEPFHLRNFPQDTRCVICSDKFSQAHCECSTWL